MVLRDSVNSTVDEPLAAPFRVVVQLFTEPASRLVFDLSVDSPSRQN
jgi:hypothetical protein